RIAAAAFLANSGEAASPRRYASGSPLAGKSASEFGSGPASTFSVGYPGFPVGNGRRGCPNAHDDNKTIRTSAVGRCFMVLFDLRNQRRNCLVDRGLCGIVTRSFDLRGTGGTCNRGLAVATVDVHHYFHFRFAEFGGLITPRDLSEQAAD